jgi:hypothetical protein
VTRFCAQPKSTLPWKVPVITTPPSGVLAIARSVSLSFAPIFRFDTTLRSKSSFTKKPSVLTEVSVAPLPKLSELPWPRMPLIQMPSSTTAMSST